MFEAMDADLSGMLVNQIAELEDNIEQVIVTDEKLANMTLIAAVPELGQLLGERAAALTGLDHIAPPCAANALSAVADDCCGM